MFVPLLGVMAIGLVICVSEFLWRKKYVGAEGARKITHISVGTFVAFWPFFTTFLNVQLLAWAFLIVIIISRLLHVFKGIHSVKRKGIGEIFYPLGIAAAATLTTNKYVFAAAILHLSLADGLAAIVGIKYGKQHRYHVGELTKSYVGSVTFMAVSFVVTGLLIVGQAGVGASWPLLLFIPIITALVENIAPYGSDNLFVPLCVLSLVSLSSAL